MWAISVQQATMQECAPKQDVSDSAYRVNSTAIQNKMAEVQSWVTTATHPSASPFFKSIGYTAVAALIGAGLSGVSLPSSRAIEERWPATGAGGAVIAIHVDSIIPQEIFGAESDRMIRDVRNTYEPMPGYDRALLPGTIEEENMARHRIEGIRYGEMEQKNAREISERLNVPLPWT